MPVILAAPCTGKSVWVKTKKNWQDQENLTKIHRISWTQHEHRTEEERKHYIRLDKELKTLSKTHNVVGSLFWNYVPDAIVIIPHKLHLSRIKKRNQSGIETVNEADAVAVATFLRGQAKKHGVRVFTNFGDAAQYIYWNAPIAGSKQNAKQ